MVVVLESGIAANDKESLRRFLQDHGYQVREIVGERETIFGAVGSAGLDIREVELRPGVARVIPISKPYKLASRELKRADTVVQVGPVKIGGNRVVVIAGPCSVESRENIIETAKIVAASGAVMLRGGAFKPRTSPYSFQGMGEEGLKYLKEAGEITGMPVISEIVSPSHLDLMREYVDVFQIGARNMQNFELLKAVGASGKPVMVKRGLAATIEEWLMAAEYVLAQGAEDVILCERGIRTFETYTRNTLDIAAIPVVKKLSHLPVIVDPSHATGLREKVSPVGLAAIAAGADGIIVEVHPDPDHALSDGPQSLYPQQFEKLMRDIEALSPVVSREVARLPRGVGFGVAARGAAARLGAAGTQSDVVPGHGGVPAGQGSAAGARPAAGALRVAFQGARGAYSELAVRRYFDAVPLEPVSNAVFRDVFEAVLAGTVDYGVVPLENSLMGSIHENYDLLLQYPDIHIVGETHIRIEHALIAPPSATLESIREVYSQTPGIEQCRAFLNEHPDWKLVPFYDTAGAVEHVSKLNVAHAAAIAGAHAAEVYGMRVLKQGIETNPRNYTRFAVLARIEHERPADATMATLVFSVSHTPGSLFACLKVLSEHELNMKKLESRPILGQPWQYMFYVDVELPSDRARFEHAVELLNETGRNVRILGLFRGSRGFGQP